MRELRWSVEQRSLLTRSAVQSQIAVAHASSQILAEASVSRSIDAFVNSRMSPANQRHICVVILYESLIHYTRVEHGDQLTVSGTFMNSYGPE